MFMDTFSPFARPLYVMLKPAGAACNLHCAYCYYLEKAHTLGHDRPAVMTDETLERFTRQYLAAQTQRDVLFVWHGGEPMLRPLAFYEKAVTLQRKYAGTHCTDNCIQTNGTLITEEWSRFLKANNWLVGVSVDGTEEMHTRYRGDSWRKVMQGIDLLNRYGVEWNAMATVNRFNADRPVEFYRFFKNIGCRYIQFTPIVERTDSRGRLVPVADDAPDGRLTEESVTPEQWGRFCCGLFDEWVKADIGEYFIQLFDATLANWCGVEPGVCSLAATCGNAMAMEPEGDVYSCDHFVFPQFRIGNIHRQTLIQMGYGQEQNLFRRLKPSLTRQCRECEWLEACHGECPKNRFAVSVYGERGQNYLCPGYREYFSHVAPYMDRMREAIRRGGSAADIL